MDKGKKLVSVLLSIYNVENYIEECLDSILNQSYKNLEIVCVNNGSPDRCAEILAAYRKRDQRIKIITLNENKKVCGGRNAGLDNATGEFICFVDPDDIIGRNHIKAMMDAIQGKLDPEGNPLNLIINNSAVSFCVDKQNRREIIRSRDIPEGIYSIDDYNLNPMLEMVAPMWGRLYRKSFIDKLQIRFLDGVHTDNIPFTTKLLAHMKYWYGICSYDDDSSYWYRLITPDGSITPQIALRSIELPYCLENLYDYLKQHGLARKVKVMFYHFFRSYFPRHEDQPRYYQRFKELMVKMEEDIKSDGSIYTRQEIDLCNYLIYTNNFFQFAELYFRPQIRQVTLETQAVTRRIVTVVKLLNFIPFYRKKERLTKRTDYYIFGIPIIRIAYNGRNARTYRLFAFIPLWKILSTKE